MVWIFIAVAFVIGMMIGWSLCCTKEKATADVRQKHIEDLKTDLQSLREKYEKSLENSASLSTTLGTHKENLKSVQDAFVSAFENLSNKIIAEQSNKFSKHSIDIIENSIVPLQNQLSGFKNDVNKISAEHALERRSLREQVKAMMGEARSLEDETNRLTNALKGDFRTQGSWGELILEKVLEAAGLTQGSEYIRHADGMDLRGETNEILKPDVVIMLPDNKHLIVDAKMTFPHYYSHCNAENDHERKEYENKLMRSIEEKIDSLCCKNYISAAGVTTVDFVVMFIPVESIFSLAIRLDSGLIERSWQKGVVLCGPTHLFSLLRTIACIWNVERQNRNTEQIATKGAALYNDFAKLLHAFKKLERQMQTVLTTFNAVTTKIGGRQGLISKVNQLKELGLQTKEKISDEIGDLSNLDEALPTSDLRETDDENKEIQ